MNFRMLILPLFFSMACTPVISDELALTALTPDEEFDLCTELSDGVYRPTSAETCEVNAILGTTDTPMCEANRDTCLAEPIDPVQVPGCEENAGVFVGCNLAPATVGDARRCIAETQRSIERFYEQTCSDIDELPVLDDAANEACEVLMRACPTMRM